MSVHRDHRLGVVSLAVMTTALMAVGTVSQFTFGALGPFLVAEFELSRAQFGALTTVLFGIAALFSAWAGRGTDRVSARLSYSTAFWLSAATLAGIAVSPTYLVLVAFAALGGIAQALVNPLSNKLVADHAPRQRQGIVMGIKQSGVQMGAVVAGFSLPLIASLAGWRTAVGAVAVLTVVGWVVSVRSLPSRAPGSGAERDSRPAGVGRVVVVLGTYAFLMGSVMAAVNAYLPLYAHEVIGLTPAVAGTLVAVIGFVGIASRITVGHLTDRAGDIGLLLNAMAAVGTVAVLCILLAARFGTWLIWVGALVFGWSVAWNTLAMIAVVRFSGAGDTGRASGYVLTGFFAGFIVAPVAFGTAVDVVGYTLPWVALVVLLVGVSAAIWLWRWRTRRAGGG